jgi:hypothetical protein
MRRSLAVLAALAGAAAPVLAQQKVTKSPAAPRGAAGGARAETAAFVVTLGSDTTAVERFTRTPTPTGARIEGDLLTRTPSVRVVHYTIALDRQGNPADLELAFRRPDGSPMTTGVLGLRGAFGRDSAIFTVQRADSASTVRAGGIPTGTLLSFGPSYAMWETALRAMRQAGRDSGAITIWAPGAPQPQALPVRLGPGDSARVIYFGDPMLLRVDREGRILALDGARTTTKSTATRVGDVDVAALAQRFAASPAMGQTSPRDTARASIGAAELLVDYGRPSARGRTVWGGTLVPTGQVWRTGANQATHFRTSAPLTLGDLAVPAGTYTLFTMPEADGSYRLIVSKQTGQWGTEYKPEMDLGRVALASTTLAEPVEQFTIAIEPAGATAGQLVMRWGTQQLAVPVTVR